MNMNGWTTTVRVGSRRGGVIPLTIIVFVRSTTPSRGAQLAYMYVTRGVFTNERTVVH